MFVRDRVESMSELVIGIKSVLGTLTQRTDKPDWDTKLSVAQTWLGVTWRDLADLIRVKLQVTTWTFDPASRVGCQVTPSRPSHGITT